VRSSLCTLEICEAISVAFVTLEGEASYTASHRPRAHKIVVSHGKVYEAMLHIRKEISKS
jgi:hypothetical protein